MKPIDCPNNVSVIIPVYEAASFIVGTLETVAAQTLLPLEVVIIDDGSSDNTCDVIEAFSHATPHLNIRLLREPHRGPGAARNTGVVAANGDWIAFLDSDDLWKPQKLERMAVASQSMPDANFLCHNEIHRYLDGSEHVVDYFLGYHLDRSLPEQLYKNNRFSTSAVICRKEPILSCGGFDNTFPNAQDYELWLRMSPRIKVLFVTEVLGVYVDRTGNISSGRAWRRFKNVVRVLYRHRLKVGLYTRIMTLSRLLLSHCYRRILVSVKPKISS
ncbi:MAG: glycosyltransferase [Cellvibrio sp.]|uniref:glycosyltransferase family 2 protein n=1 Tax=Cellvibrio sp. TaxID=1965322 RepID=UPI00271F915A|nr:glycosyltransferase [Cellvibrio sp.]